MGGPKVTEDTFTRHLPYSVTQRLASMLDPGRLWEQLAVNIPKELCMLDRQSDDFEPKFSDSFVSNVVDRGRKLGGSCTRTILSEWSTQNTKVKHLVKVLTMARLYAAADYISIDILKGERVPRLNQEPALTPVIISKSPSTPIGDGPPLVNGKLREPQEQAEVSGGVTAYQRKFQCEIGMGETSGPSSDMSGEMLNISHRSGLPSADLKGGNSIASGRMPSESDEFDDGTEESLRQVIISDDIKLRRIDYKLLRHITNNFNNEELSKGGNLLGKGGFGTVYLGQFGTGFEIAVKCLKDDNEYNLKQFTTELEVLAKYRHENIVHLLGYSQEDGNHCLIYEYVLNGSLEDRLACRNKTPPLRCQMRVEIAKGTARGIEYLNSCGVVHRDIKSANVLLDKDFTPKVGDFATARAAPKGTGTSAALTSVVIGTSAYLAPEAHHFDVSTKLDTYSFGVVLLELLTGLPAFDEKREDKDIKSHVDENCEDIMEMVDREAGSWREDVAMAMFNIANRCLERRKKKRPLIEDILPELLALASESQA